MPNVDSDTPEKSSVSGGEYDAGESTGQEIASDSSFDADAKTDLPDSSSGEDAKKADDAWDPLSVAKNALDVSRGKEKNLSEEESQPDESSESEGNSEKDSDSKELGEVTKEELDSYKPATRKRIESLLDERQRLTQRVESLEKPAEQFEQIQGFMQERSLSSEQVAEGLVIMGLARSDNPEDLRKALERSREFVSGLEAALGESIPADLQKKVDDGYLDEETAKEVARERAEKVRLQNRADTTEKAYQNTQRENSVKDVIGTITAWDQQKQSTDPDYAKKRDLFKREVQRAVAMNGGPISDPNRALKVAEEAYSFATEMVNSLSPKPQVEPKKFTRSRSAPTNAASQPKTSLEAARQGLEKLRRGD